MYSHAICWFASRPHVALDLHEALLQYRSRLRGFSLTYQFDSIRTYHHAFMTKRIFRGQDDPVAWLTEDYRLQHCLVPKQKYTQAGLPSKTSASVAASGSFQSCNKFNAGECSKSPCRYPHVCSICQQGHSAKECRSRLVASNSNSVPLGSRITAP